MNSREYQGRIAPSRRKNYDDFNDSDLSDSDFGNEKNEMGENSENDAENELYANLTPSQIIELYKSRHLNDGQEFLDEQMDYEVPNYHQKSMFSRLDASYSDDYYSQSPHSLSSLADSSGNSSNNSQSRNPAKKTHSGYPVLCTRDSRGYDESVLFDGNYGDVSPKSQTSEQSIGFHIDLQQLSKTQGCDSEQNTSRIPSRLSELIREPKNSLTFTALCGESIVGYQQQKVDEAIANLKYYLKMCVNLGYIEESAYLQSILNDYAEKKRELDQEPSLGSTAAQQEKLDSALEERDQNFQKWENRKAQLSSEQEIAEQDLDMRLQSALEQLNKEWNSERKRCQYSKPSQKLVSIRTLAKKNLQARRFDLAANYRAQLVEQEKIESEEAGKRMQKDYSNAVQKLKAKFELERETLNTQFQTRKNKLERMQEIDMGKYDKRVEKEQNALTKQEQKETSVEKQIQQKSRLKSREVPSSYSKIRHSSASLKVNPDLIIMENRKLQLPSLIMAKRKEFKPFMTPPRHTAPMRNSIKPNSSALASLPPESISRCSVLAQWGND